MSEVEVEEGKGFLTKRRGIGCIGAQWYHQPCQLTNDGNDARDCSLSRDLKLFVRATGVAMWKLGDIRHRLCRACLILVEGKDHVRNMDGKVRVTEHGLGGECGEGFFLCTPCHRLMADPAHP